MLQLATRAVMQHDTYNRRDPVMSNVSFTDTKVRLKHIFIIQFIYIIIGETERKSN